jgi:DNA-binding response OmpR family regulator
MPDRILVVDDEIDELTGWQTALQKAGYRVQIASTAAAALALCDESMFDLVILDYVMPKMKGLELLARIRKKIPLVRSIVVSAKLDLPEQGFRDTIRGEVETDRYFHKPVTNEQLLAAIAEVLKEAKPSRPWSEIAADHVEEGKSNVSKAISVQGKLRKHIKRR